ncbi:hypothetical protein CI109_105924 [Kwoniella shandongensis]|uniref:Uncharacterized protein n=1 Tax=Kwoniella shandongensis TaxID=1734106 RepID=A0A5M6BQ32_9TREE|nr:uncharacterized protein CI109_006646 [Kwoniella shandongensis]KAA5525006.1 hypothetical protein CI109_006646 [Kwoniella shandongensis]
MVSPISPPAGSNRSDPRTEARAAALAAAEARLRPPPSYDAIAVDPESSTSTSSPGASQSSNPLFGGGRTSALPVDNYKPTEKEDRELRVKFGRLLDRGIVRDNGYKQSLEAVETLIKIATNIQNSDDPKYRTLKASNTLLKNKVLAVKGGQDYLIALGFRTQAIDFTHHFVFQKTLKKMHELEIGVTTLKDHVEALQKRVENSSKSAIAHAQEEAARKANALREIEADRDLVKTRVERERIVREAREKAEREKVEREAQVEAENVVQAVEDDRIDMLEAVTRDEDNGDNGEEEEEEDEDDELPSYREDRDSRRWGGPGRRLGA